jgi:acyl carrier protein phosphodiesterase
MNYLAHLFLAGDTRESLIGNLAGDFVKGPLHDRFPRAIADGIAMHRRIDAFTDTHPEVAAFRRVLIPEIGHYARVVADVFFDHFLACDWSLYSSESLEEFLERAWSLIDGHELPGRLAHVYPRMRDEGWLLGYAELDGVRMALRGISWRLSRSPQLEPVVHHLIDSRDSLRYHFSRFFPDVLRFARAFRA